MKNVISIQMSKIKQKGFQSEQISLIILKIQ